MIVSTVVITALIASVLYTMCAHDINRNNLRTNSICIQLLELDLANS
jgi:hypothetical protein